MNANLNIGTFTTCQLGNSFDTGWTETSHANQACEILRVKESKTTGNVIYLIKTEKLLGIASLSRGGTKGVLHCTTALPCSEDELSEKAYSLGFNL